MDRYTRTLRHTLIHSDALTYTCTHAHALHTCTCMHTPNVLHTPHTHNKANQRHRMQRDIAHAQYTNIHELSLPLPPERNTPIHQHSPHLSNTTLSQPQHGLCACVRACVRALCVCTVCVHCVCALCVCTVCVHCVCALCAFQTHTHELDMPHVQACSGCVCAHSRAQACVCYACLCACALCVCCCTLRMCVHVHACAGCESMHMHTNTYAHFLLSHGA